MQYLQPEERKGEDKYKHGDWIQYDDRPTEEEQLRAYERAQKWGDRVSTCVYCGRIVTGRKTYCSQRCVNDAYMERRMQRHEAALKKTCAVCGKHFTAKRADAKYCSSACKQAAYRKRVTDNRLAKFARTDNGNSADGVTDNRSSDISRTDSGNGRTTTETAVM